ncbi:GNAT family N-acetyltransferase [Falsibacillus pallidus]|uniref:Acetyltransferase (GNAT) family protein n=1 Tax=Falsibacillus pallidus TaxID=493781 RepID=A0A370GQ22_9BACI|nr:GNAT family N-acetyltransferase [Falsibacillus pallidus]RDI45812.1 acetyltransferase (GNAT) family protein [Falsibacillus pallidus]
MNDSVELALQFEKMRDGTANAALEIIIQGLKEYFDPFDIKYNEDLVHFRQYYMESPNTHQMYIGKWNGEIVCTGALSIEDIYTGRIQRLSVKTEFRKMGFGAEMLIFLESIAAEQGFDKIVLETNRDWEKAIRLYQRAHYIEETRSEEEIHFCKVLAF